MIKYPAFLLILTLRIFYQPSHTTAEYASFTSPSSFIKNNLPARLLSIQGSINNDKVLLNWTVGENETADQFEIQKSTNGKDFKLAALVFGTDKPESAEYHFYERAAKEKVLYRVKLINKDKKTEYSPVVEIAPAV